jgi:heme exporter protein C
MNRRDGALTTARRGSILTVLALAGFAGVYVRALMFTPIERFQGPAQKILYVHAPIALTTLLAFGVTGLLSLLYLILKDRRLDHLAASSAEVGVVLSIAMLTTWGKPIWGTWWTWDARLTSTLFLFLLFVGYLVLRDALTDFGMRARYSAVLGVLALGLVPFIHMTVYWFRTLHPAPVLLKPDAPSMPGVMLVTLLSSLAVVITMYVGFLMQRYALSVLEDVREEEAALELS